MLSATPKLLRDERAALQAALDRFRGGLSGRASGSGQRQSGTQTEDQAFAALKAQVQATDQKLLGPRFYDHPAEKARFYPDKLSGLTQAPKAKRLTRFTAYVKQLEGHDEAAIQAAGQQTRALLAAYTAATAAKNQGAKAVKDTISALGPDALALADALWSVHCTALYVHRQEPAKAPTYFDYTKLGKRNARRPASPRLPLGRWPTSPCTGAGCFGSPSDTSCTGAGPI
ncbi:hypothetical protein [Hymenobacter jeollabukensis]|uniref:Uncharacterized protein n=1 Tax=Hymenobacter jeollabukensis TaxID=2025313 RepID=A0A5R8WSM1_9BACT|nr:hypothetical protein [Hymenobacter jeollabukensis]TLM93371.1 hypothetical protein FDY95_12225 [Hymenobacter jeollabukensis]